MTDLKFNVAQLLREEMGSRRDHTFTEDVLPLDEQLQLREISGTVRFTRTATGVWAKVEAKGTVRLTCVRSLELFDEQVSVEFVDQFHSLIDVFTGGKLPQPIEDDPFFLNEYHMADIGEALREYTLLTLPLNPLSPAHRDHPVSYSVQSEGLEVGDEPGQADVDPTGIEALKAWADRHNKRTGRS